MTGYLPAGYESLDQFRDRLGPSEAGSLLAAGKAKCYRIDPWGVLHFVDPAFWRGQYAKEAMDIGRVPKRKHLTDSHHLLLVKTEETRDAILPIINSTGAPGRPTSAHVVRAELRRRQEAVETENSLAAESRYLETWLRENHPNAAPMTAKTIENAIRTLWRRTPRN